MATPEPPELGMGDPWKVNVLSSGNNFLSVLVQLESCVGQPNRRPLGYVNYGL